MSRSAVVALITGLVLLAAFGVVANMYRHGLAGLKWWMVVIILGLGVYGACLAAVCLRRIIDPKLDTPWLALLLALAWFIMGALSKKSDDDTTHDSSSNDSSDGPMGLGWAIFTTLVGLGMYAGGIALLWGFTSHPALAHSTKVTTPAPVAEPKPAGPQPVTTTAPTTAIDITNVADLTAAIEFARPHFNDDRSAPNRGAKLLARYAAVKLAWKDLAIAKNETSLELVEKDPPKAMGKRLCVTGTLARIEKVTVDGTDAYSARLTSKTGDAIEMFAVGDTGALVKRKPARFCGVVTGRLDVDGKPATFAVGMLQKP